MYYDDYDGFLRARRWRRIGVASAIAIVVLAAAFGYWKWQLASDSHGSPGTVAVAEVETSISSDTTTDETTIDGNSTTSSITRTTTTATTVATTNTGPATSSAPTTSVSSVPATADTSPSGYPIGADGLPLPLVVIFDTQTITISGQVPSQAARDRLDALAMANSQFPDAKLVDNLLINPAVPISVGVRVLELNSARFPEGSSTILPDHAKELDRVVAIMKALPNISVVVVGHADQRGDDITNFAVSDARARAVVNYLFYLGISPTRLSSRAAGDTDLLTVGDDAAALALNRRTEFIFFGLLIP